MPPAFPAAVSFLTLCCCDIVKRLKQPHPAQTQRNPEVILFTVPNVLTLLRILALPVIFVLILKAGDGASIPAMAVFFVAAFTDFLDGFLARGTGAVSEFGKAFDPLADRIFIGGTVIALVIAGRLPLIGVALVVARDILMIVGYKLLRNRAVILRVSLLGKSYTALFMLAILLTLADAGPWIWLFWAGVAGSLVTGAAYVIKGFAELRKKNIAA